MRRAGREASGAGREASGRFLPFSCLLALALCLLTSPVTALGRRDLGTTGAQFLKIPVSPRVAALADAYGALGDDVSTIFSNPAGLSVLPRKQIQFTHAELAGDISLNSIFYAHPIPRPLGTFALNYTNLDYGSMTRTVLNAPGAANPFSIAGDFSAYDHLLAVAYSDEFLWRTHRFRWGMTAKFIQQTIGDESATGLAYDFGVIYAPVGSTWRVGAAVQNLGFLSKFRYEADPLPLNLKLSAGKRFMDDRLRLGLDVNIPNDNTPVVNLGAEVLPIPALALRGGYRFDDNTSDYEGPTVGAGVNLAGVALDYAYVPYERLGGNHRFSLAYSFGAPVREPDYQPALPPPPSRARASRQPPPAESPYEPPVHSGSPRVSVSVSTEPSYEEPAYVPPVAAPDYGYGRPEPEFGVRAMPFAFAGGPLDYDWIGAATIEVLHKNWMGRGYYRSSGPLVVEGECRVEGTRLFMTARLSLDERVLGTFSSEGDAEMPFEAWDNLANAINGRLASLGVGR